MISPSDVITRGITSQLSWFVCHGVSLVDTNVGFIPGI